MDDIDVNDYDSYSLHRFFSLWRLFPKKNKLMLVRPLNSFIAGKLFPNFRSNILPERLGMARCKGALPRLYNSTTNNFAAGYQSTRSFVKLGNSSNTTEAPPIFVAHVCLFFSVEILKQISSRLSRPKHKMESRGSFRTETPLVPTKRCSSLKTFNYSTWWFRNFRPACPKKHQKIKHIRKGSPKISRYLCF